MSACGIITLSMRLARVAPNFMKLASSVALARTGGAISN